MCGVVEATGVFSRGGFQCAKTFLGPAGLVFKLSAYVSDGCEMSRRYAVAFYPGGPKSASLSDPPATTVEAHPLSIALSS